MENLTGGNPPVSYLTCVVSCKLYFVNVSNNNEHFEQEVIHGDSYDVVVKNIEKTNINYGAVDSDKDSIVLTTVYKNLSNDQKYAGEGVLVSVAYAGNKLTNLDPDKVPCLVYVDDGSGKYIVPENYILNEDESVTIKYAFGIDELNVMIDIAKLVGDGKDDFVFDIDYDTLNGTKNKQLKIQY